MIRRFLGQTKDNMIFFRAPLEVEITGGYARKVEYKYQMLGGLKNPLHITLSGSLRNIRSGRAIKIKIKSDEITKLRCDELNLIISDENAVDYFESNLKTMPVGSYGVASVKKIRFRIKEGFLRLQEFGNKFVITWSFLKVRW